MNKKVIAVIYGGCSVEHEISLISAESIIKNIDTEEFDIFPVFINKSGVWKKGRTENLNELKEDKDSSDDYLVPSLGFEKHPSFIEVRSGKVVNNYPVELAFPVLHGTLGEDGTVQGLFELMGLPYVGASVLGSSVGMDKIIMKAVLRNSGLPVVDSLGFSQSQWNQDREGIVSEISDTIKFPCFVKSADLGSSIGISKVDSEDDVEEAVVYSLNFSSRVIVEKAVRNCREIEVSVLGNDDPVASVPGEIVPSREFYDYKAKYDDETTGLIIPAEIEPELVNRLKSYATQAFKALDCSGMGRIDFLLDGESKDIFISEINTIPGFTSISMYPKLWEASGIGYADLIKRLISLAIEKSENKKSLEKSFKDSI